MHDLKVVQTAFLFGIQLKHRCSSLYIMQKQWPICYEWACGPGEPVSDIRKIPDEQASSIRWTGFKATEQTKLQARDLC